MSTIDGSSYYGTIGNNGLNKKYSKYKMDFYLTEKVS